MQRASVIVFVATALALAAPALAQQPQPLIRVRGTIEAVDAPNLTIRSRTGETVKVRLADNARVTSFVKASVADLKPNTYVGVTSVPAPTAAKRPYPCTSFRRSGAAPPKAGPPGTFCRTAR